MISFLKKRKKRLFGKLLNAFFSGMGSNLEGTIALTNFYMCITFSAMFAFPHATFIIITGASESLVLTLMELSYNGQRRKKQGSEERRWFLALVKMGDAEVEGPGHLSLP